MERADGGHEEDGSKERWTGGGWRERVAEAHREEEEEDKERWGKKGKTEEEGRKEKERSESEAAGAVGYLLQIQPLTMPL